MLQVGEQICLNRPPFARAAEIPVPVSHIAISPRQASVERKRLAEREPRLYNTELSKRLGQMWKSMTEADKVPYRKETDRLKAKLMEEHPLKSTDT